MIEARANPAVTLEALDLYTTHYPMTAYGFAALRAGQIPFWNPYQLCGEPFLAVNYTGLLYPFHFVYLLLPVALATEVSFLMHMFFGACGMWWLLRSWGVGTDGGLCSAVTFAWSGWLILNANEPSLFEGMTWMPLTVLLFDRVARGADLAWLWLVIALACQLLLGAHEILLHTMYVGTIFAAGRMVCGQKRGQA